MAEYLGTLNIFSLSRIIISVFNKPFLIYPATVKTFVELIMNVLYI